ncbi:hypothetical protein HY256_02920, partial [Candidatus Sumerlaeota bacterium]|nr:hypothetical protein [Candidatus Sumerlaeota bacterium]
MQDSELSAALRSEAQDFGAAAAIGSTDLMNRALAETELGIPLWCDFFGDPMAERQMLAMIHGSDDGLSGQWEMMVPALRRADRLSGCSRRQVGAIEGEMATLGRLNRHTAHERLVACIPPWIEPIPPSASQTKLLRGVKMPEDAFIVLQTGGFNSWLDARTLFAALESAMAENPKIYFAATGGAIPGHNNKTYDLFASLVSASRNKERYHLLGWIPLGDVPRVIAEADLGLNVDLPCLEGWLGTRNRIMDWIMGGLPVVSTLGTELVEELNRHGLIRTTAQGDAKKLAELILEMAGNRHASRGQAEQARAHLIEAYSAHRCLNPLLDWASAPSHAPDLAAWQNNRATPSQLWRDAENNPSALDEARVRLARAD